MFFNPRLVSNPKKNNLIAPLKPLNFTFLIGRISRRRAASLPPGPLRMTTPKSAQAGGGGRVVFTKEGKGGCHFVRWVHNHPFSCCHLRRDPEKTIKYYGGLDPRRSRLSVKEEKWKETKNNILKVNFLCSINFSQLFVFVSLNKSDN